MGVAWIETTMEEHRGDGLLLLLKGRMELEAIQVIRHGGWLEMVKFDMLHALSV